MRTFHYNDSSGIASRRYFSKNTHRRWNHLKINELTLPELKGQILPIQASLQASRSDMAVEEDRRLFVLRRADGRLTG